MVFPKKVPIDAMKYNMEYVDATCPLVSKVHREAENLNKARISFNINWP